MRVLVSFDSILPIFSYFLENMFSKYKCWRMLLRPSRARGTGCGRCRGSNQPVESRRPAQHLRRARRTGPHIARPGARVATDHPEARQLGGHARLRDPALQRMGRRAARRG